MMGRLTPCHFHSSTVGACSLLHDPHLLQWCQRCSSDLGLLNETQPVAPPRHSRPKQRCKQVGKLQGRLQTSQVTVLASPWGMNKAPMRCSTISSTFPFNRPISFSPPRILLSASRCIACTAHQSMLMAAISPNHSYMSGLDPSWHNTLTHSKAHPVMALRIHTHKRTGQETPGFMAASTAAWAASTAL